MITSTAFILFNDDDEEVKIENVVAVEPASEDFAHVHSHEEGACLDTYVPRENIRLITVRTAYAA